jgi:hypothetical protein
MTRDNNELDEYGKRTLAPLDPTPPLDPKSVSDARAKFLLEGENLRQAINQQPGEEVGRQVIKNHDILWLLHQKSVMKSLVTLLLVFVFILAGSSVTVYASQSSLPGEPLYPVKSWTEDVRIAMTTSPDAKLSLTLDYTNRRVDEISVLLADGKTVNEQTSDRFQKELEDALQLAAQLDDTHMQVALGEIKSHAEKQGLTMKELISKLPPQAIPAVIKLQERLNEQVKLSDVGKTDPADFRLQVHERLKNLQRTKHAPDAGQSHSTPEDVTVTPGPKHDNGNNEDDLNQPSEAPGETGPGNGQGQPTPGEGQGQPTPGEGNHGHNPTHTPKP